MFYVILMVISSEISTYSIQTIDQLTYTNRSTTSSFMTRLLFCITDDKMSAGSHDTCGTEERKFSKPKIVQGQVRHILTICETKREGHSTKFISLPLDLWVEDLLKNWPLLLEVGVGGSSVSELISYAGFRVVFDLFFEYGE